MVKSSGRKGGQNYGTGGNSNDWNGSGIRGGGLDDGNIRIVFIRHLIGIDFGCRAA